MGGDDDDGIAWHLLYINLQVRERQPYSTRLLAAFRLPLAGRLCYMPPRECSCVWVYELTMCACPYLYNSLNRIISDMRAGECVPNEATERRWTSFSGHSAHDSLLLYGNMCVNCACVCVWVRVWVRVCAVSGRDVVLCDSQSIRINRIHRGHSDKHNITTQRHSIVQI